MVVNIIDGEIVGYMTSKEAAKFLRVQTGTIRQWIRRGKINDLDYFTLNVDGNHNIHYISRMFVLEKFEEMYPEVAEAAKKRKKILHDYFRVSVKNRKNTDVDEKET